MKKILIIVRDFPPYSGRGNVMRMLKFAKYLPEFGWQPFIIAEEKDDIEDSSLLKQLPASVKIEYVCSKTPEKRKNEYKRKLKGRANLSISQKIGYFIYRSVGYNVYALYQNYIMAPDLGLFWANDALEAAISLHGQHRFDAFLTTGPPFSTFKVGIKLKQQLGIPWVLDFRDGWVGNPIYAAAKKIFINLQNQKLENEVVEKANLSIFVTDPMRRIYEKRYPKQRQKMTIITNGFDVEDYVGIHPKVRSDDKLHFVYSGTISGKQLPTTFLKGLIKAINQSNEIKQYLKITFVGKFNYHNPELLNGVKDLLDIPGMLSHRASLEKMNEADVFLLLINPSGGKTMMTSKIFEYLAFKKPICAVSIPCAATELLEKNNAGYVADWANEADIAEQILRIYRDWKEGSLKRLANAEDLSQFDRKNLTIKLARNLDRIISKEQK